MLKFRFAIFGAGAALVLGMGTALAMQSATGGNDSHGDAVASAARTTCPHGPGGVHGQCVSAIASSKGDETSTGSKSKTKATCNSGDAKEDGSESAAAATENSSETAVSNGKAAAHSEDKSERTAARNEDKSESAGVKACVSAGSTGDSEAGDTETGDSQGGD